LLHKVITTNYHAALSETQIKTRANNCSAGQRNRFKLTPESVLTKERKSKSHQGKYLIISPAGESHSAASGLKEFALIHGDLLQVTYWQLFNAYRKSYHTIPTKRIRSDANNWKVTRIDND